MSAFVERHRIGCHHATFSRRVTDYEQRIVHGIVVTPSVPWSALPDEFLGVFLGLLTLHNDSARKRRGLKPVTAVIAMFKKWCRDEMKLTLNLPDSTLRAISVHRHPARIALQPQGEAAYHAIAGRYLQTAHERLERVQMDFTEVKGPFLTPTGEVIEKVHVLVGICVATKVIVGFDYFLRTPRATDVIRLVWRIVMGKGPGIAGTTGAPIGTIQTDNGVFRCAEMAAFLTRIGTQLERIRPRQPVENGMVEKANGDIKRGLIYDLREETALRLQFVSNGGRIGYSLANLEMTLARVVDDLNNGSRRESNPLMRWEKTPPLSGVKHDWQAHVHAGGYIEHRDIVWKNDTILFDGDCLAKPAKLTQNAVGKFFVREYLGRKAPLKLFLESGMGTPVDLGHVSIVGRPLPPQACTPPISAAVAPNGEQGFLIQAELF